jgi:hypothetical protein
MLPEYREDAMHLILKSVLAVWICLSLFSYPAYGGELDVMAGTSQVQFETLRVGSQVLGCSLTFKAVTGDRALRPIVLVGAIGFFAHNGAGALTLNLGVNDFPPKGSFRPPFSAYLKTTADSTEGIAAVEQPSPGGLRMYLYPLELVSARILKSIIDGQPVTIGFKPIKQSELVLATLDLTVMDVDGPGNKITEKQTHSPLMVRQFSACLYEVYGRVIQKK